VKTDAFSVVHLVMLKFSEMVTESFLSQYDVAFRNALNELLALDDVAHICHLRHKESETEVVVATTHLHYNPINPHLKAMQAYLLMTAIESHLSQWDLPKESTLVVLAGDFNSLPNKKTPDEFDRVIPEGGFVSGVYQLITEGFLPSSHLDHPAVRDPAIIILNSPS